ncbi:MAG: alpha-N-arabinofuranosidase [Gemmatimonadetes bacterium]|nr:alpha-N-arabinofuranosidase [Gemmatimonadota bacterium]
MRLTHTLLCLAVLACSSPAAGQTRLVVNADLGKDTISRHIYGHFAEHLGRGIYDGFWYRANENAEPRLREDVIAALRAIRIPNLRWPGGCFADYYHWRDGIGPRASRPRMVNSLWGEVVEDNSFGTHEFMDLVERLGAEPLVVGNVGSGTVQEMADWWEYLNHPGGSTLAQQRAANGHPEPYGVRFWGVGNESWGCGGNMTPQHYADVYRNFAEFIRSMRGVQPFRIASGPYMDRRLAVDLNDWGDPFEWTETLMREAGGDIDGVDFHYYTFARLFGATSPSATDFDEHDWFVTMDLALNIDSLIDRHASIMDRYDPGKRVSMIIGEWGLWHDVEPGTNPGFLYQQSTIRDAVLAGIHLNIFNNHADRIRMANLAQTINVLQSVILTQGEQLLLTPTYHVFDLYQVHQDAVLLPTHLEHSAYTVGKDSVEAVTASASRDRNGRVHITLTNQDPNRSRALAIELRGMTAAAVSGRVLTGDAMNAHNTFADPKHVVPVDFTGMRLRGNTLSVDLPPRSVVALEVR